MKEKALAIFDLDGTLTGRNSFLSFMFSTHSFISIAGNTLILSPRLLLFLLGLYDNQKIKEQVLKVFYGSWKKETMLEAGNRFCEEKLPSLMRNDVYSRMKWHRDNGHEVVVLSASCSAWIARWCENEQIALIASELSYEDGCITGKLEGKNCQGEEKKKRLAAAYDLSSFEKIYAYGNSQSDRHYMDLAHEQYLIGKREMQWRNE